MRIFLYFIPFFFVFIKMSVVIGVVILFQQVDDNHKIKGRMNLAHMKPV